MSPPLTPISASSSRVRSSPSSARMSSAAAASAPVTPPIIAPATIPGGPAAEPTAAPSATPEATPSASCTRCFLLALPALVRRLLLFISVQARKLRAVRSVRLHVGSWQVDREDAPSRNLTEVRILHPGGPKEKRHEIRNRMVARSSHRARRGLVPACSLLTSDQGRIWRRCAESAGPGECCPSARSAREGSVILLPGSRWTHCPSSGRGLVVVLVPFLTGYAHF